MKNSSVNPAFLLCLVAGLLLPQVAGADEIFLSSQESLKGLVVEQHADRVVVSTIDGEQTVMRTDIDEIFFDDPERNYLYLGDEALAQGDINSASTLFRKATQLNPELEECRDAIRRVEDRQQKMAKELALPDPELKLFSTDRYPKVEEVKPASAASESGIQPGDLLVAVWGESLAYQPVSVAVERLTGLPETWAKVTVERTVQIVRDPKHPWPGFEMEMSSEGLKVSRVTGGTASAFLKPGDLIVSLNGRATRYLPLASARNAAQQSQSKKRGLGLIIHRHILLKRPSTAGEGSR